MEKHFDFIVKNNTNHFERFQIGNKSYRLYFAYNRPADSWSLTLYKEIFDDGVDIEPIVRNIRIVVGIDLFKQFKHLDIGSLWFFPKDSYGLEEPKQNFLSGEFIGEWTYETD